jgi:chorismate mutase/prephenate dehydratase
LTPEELRKKIDELDTRLVGLISERARVVQEIGRLKEASGRSPTYVPSREKEVYERVLRANSGPLPDEAVIGIWREIMSGAIALQRPTRVSYLGPPGTFTNMATRAKFGSSIEGTSEPTIRDVFVAVSRDHADYGVVPIENSTEGGVNETQDCFQQTNLKICSEVYLPVHHHLMAKCSVEEIEAVHTHPQVFGQCREWLSANLPGPARVEQPSTAAAAAIAASTPRAAAVASEMSAEIHGLTVLERNVEDDPRNVTRFFVIGKRSGARTGDDKTTVMFTLKDEVGALLKVLDAFRQKEINLTWIQSRPSKQKAWDYRFYVDLQGHEDDEPVQRALSEVAKRCHQITVLGSYPAARREDVPAAGSFV